MSSKDAYERKLRPVYDALDDARPQQALSLATTLLKKDKNFITAKAIRGLALVRLGRHEEAHVILDELKILETNDDDLLRILNVALKETGQLADIAVLYEKALKLEPDSQEYHSMLFMAYVRTRKYKDQQRVARQMFAKYKSVPYFYWSLMSVLMQAISDEKSGTGQLASKMFLPLAKKMLLKAEEEGNMEAAEHIEIYLLTLELAKEYASVREVINKDKAGAFKAKEPLILVERTADLRIASSYRLEGLWGDANVCYQALITSDPEEWTAYKYYFETLAELKNNPDKKVDGSHDFEQAGMFIKSLAEQANSTRGPHIGLMELSKRAEKFGGPNVTVEAMTPLVEAYIGRFGSKPCIFGDVQPYLTLCDSAKVISAAVSAATEETDPSKKVVRELFTIKLKRFCGEHKSADVASKVEVADECYAGYKSLSSEQAAKDGVEAVMPLEVHVEEEYLVLAAHLLWDAYHQSGDKKHLIRGLEMLKSVDITFSANFQIKLLAFRFFLALGSLNSAIEAWATLDVKQIQHDSLGYMMTDHLLPLGGYHEKILIFANRSLRTIILESPEHVCQAYKFGAFQKVQDVMHFQDRVQRSQQYVFNMCEQAHLKILNSSQLDADCLTIITTSKGDMPDKSEIDNLQNNGDMNVMDEWTSSDFSDETASISRKRAKWITYRLAVLDLLSAVLKEEDVMIQSSILELQNIKIEEEAKVSSLFPHGVQYPRSHLISVYRAYREVLSSAVAVVKEIVELFASAPRGEEREKAVASLKETVASFLNTFKEMTIIDVVEAADVASAQLESIAVVVETCVVSSILVRYWKKRAVPPPKGPGGKIKRQIALVLEAVVAPAAAAVADNVQTVRTRINTVFENINHAKSQCEVAVEKEILESQSVSIGNFKTVVEKIKL